MDWGKLAYVKAEELEKYLQVRRREGDGYLAATAVFAPRTAFCAPYTPCTLSCEGNVALTVALSLRCVQEVENASVYLYCASSPAASARITAAAGERAQMTLFASVYPSSGATLTLACDTDAVLLERVHILAQGEGVSVTSGRERMRSDAAGGRYYLAYTRDGYLYLKVYGGGEACVGHGAVFDVSATETGAEVVSADSHGNLYGYVYDESLQLQSRRLLGKAPTAVAMGKFGDERLLVGIYDGVPLYATCEAAFEGRSEWQPLLPSARADDAALSRESAYSALVLCRNGEYTMRLPLRQCAASAELSVQPRFVEK